MKNFLALLAILTVTNSYSATKSHRVVLDWSDESGEQVEAFDGEKVVAVLPYYAGIKPSVEVQTEALVVEGSCTPKSIVRKSSKVYITFELAMTGPDDGFNGCEVVIHSGHPDHEDGMGIVPLTFGLSIND